MARPAAAWLGLIWCLTHTVLVLGAGTWTADPRTPGVVALTVAAAACCRWYLRYPVGMYGPATKTFIAIGLYGIRCRLYPGDPDRTLVARGGRIVESGAGGRTVLRRVLTRQQHWAMVVQSMRSGSGRGTRIRSSPLQPSFITARHRRTGWAVFALAAAGLVYLVAVASVDVLGTGLQAVSLVDAFDRVSSLLHTVRAGR